MSKYGLPSNLGFNELLWSNKFNELRFEKVTLKIE